MPAPVIRIGHKPIILAPVILVALLALSGCGRRGLLEDPATAKAAPKGAAPGAAPTGLTGPTPQADTKPKGSVYTPGTLITPSKEPFILDRIL